MSARRLLLVLGLVALAGPTDTRAEDRLVFLGHATVLLELDGTRILTDPVFAARYSPFHRRFIPEPDTALWQSVDAVLISHPHPDHLNPETLARIPGHVPVLLSASAARHALHTGHLLRMLRPGEAARVGRITVIATRAYHPGGRAGFEPGLSGGALGFVLRTPERTVYVSGDTSWWPGIKEIGRRHHPDLAVLHINAHLSGDEALRAVVDLGAPPVVAVHHGAYGGPNERARGGRHAYLEARLGPLFWAPEVGDTLRLEGIGPDRPASVRAFGNRR